MVCTGRIQPHKGFYEAIWAFDILRFLRDDVDLVIAGAGPERRRLEKFVERTGLRNRIQLPGEVGNIAPVLAGASLAWVPSLNDTGPGFALEAMAAGLPVIASRVPALAEIVVDGETGFLIEPGNKMELARQTRRLLDDPELGIVAALLRIASPATTRLPSIMKTALGTALFRNFLWNVRRDVACNVLACSRDESVWRGRPRPRDFVGQFEWFGATYLLAAMCVVFLQHHCRRESEAEGTGRLPSETHHHRLRLEPHAPDFLDALLNLVFQRYHVCRGRSAAVHDGQAHACWRCRRVPRVYPRENRSSPPATPPKLSSCFPARDSWGQRVLLLPARFRKSSCCSAAAPDS